MPEGQHSRTQSRRFLECIGDDFMTQVIKKLIRGDSLLDLTLANKVKLVRDVMVGGSLACSDHEMMDVSILTEGNKANGSIITLDFTRTDSDLFRELVGNCSIWFWREEGPKKLDDFQGSGSPSSRMGHAHMQEVKQRQQEACLDEQVAPDKTRA